MRKLFSGWKPIYQITGITAGFFLVTILLLLFQGSFDILESWMLRTFINRAEYGNEVISLYGYTAFFIFMEALLGGISGWLIGKKFNFAWPNVCSAAPMLPIPEWEPENGRRGCKTTALSVLST